MPRDVFITTGNSQVKDWRPMAKLTIILITLLAITFQTVLPASGDAVQVEAGRTHNFVAPVSPDGKMYSYLWTATDGSPLASGGANFSWTAPQVKEPTMATISLLVSNDGASGCINQSELELLVVPALSPQKLSEITPFLECVHDQGDGNYEAIFGYKNDNSTAISIPIGPDNKFLPEPADRGQPIEFLPGLHPTAFAMSFDGEEIEWKVGQKSARASRNSQRCSLSLTGHKFNDLNANGERDEKEPGLQGWTIELQMPDSSMRSSLTGEDGSYSFKDLSPGSYQVSEVLKEGWTQSYPPQGTYEVKITDQSLFGLDFGNYGHPGIKLKKDCIFKEPARVGDTVVYTYNVSNTGELPLGDVNLTDVHDWGPSCQPAYFGGDNRNGILDPGESWIYECRYTIPDPTDYQRLHIMAAGSGRNIATIIRKLMDMRVRMEIKMDNLLAMLQQFDEKNSTLVVSNRTVDGFNYTLYNYTNPLTEETLSKMVDQAGAVRRTDYIDPATGDILTTEYSSNGRVTSVAYYSPRNMEYLKREYDRPSEGLRTYTVTDYRNGDTLILVTDSTGKTIISKEYRKTPGYRIFEEKFFVKNTATVTARSPDGQIVSDMASFTLEIFLPLPVLGISKKADPDPVKPGEIINYTITYENVGSEDAHKVVIKETYNKSLYFVSANPPPDVGSSDRWTIGSLGKGESGTIKITLRTDSSLQSGSQISNIAEISCKENVSDRAMINTTVSGVLLNITKRASSNLVSPAEIFTYTINYRNDGPDKFTGVNISDYLDEKVEFHDATPQPTDSSGRYYRWYIGELNPGDQGTVEIVVRAKSKSFFPKSATSIFNTYRIDSSESTGINSTLETLVVSGLWIKKAADKRSYYPDENITYTIKFGNAESRLKAEDVVIVDTLPEVDLVDAFPGPKHIQGNVLRWNIGTLYTNQSGTITLVVHIPKHPEVIFGETSSARGDGYARVSKRLSTTLEDKPLTNKANITGYYINESNRTLSRASDCASVIVLGAGTEIRTSEHGSGHYEEDESSSLRASNKSITLNREIFAKYERTSFSLPRGRILEHDSRWSDLTDAKNLLRDEEVSMDYLYADTLEKNSSLALDMNQTVLKSEADMKEGIARIGYVRGSVKHPVVDISEDYHGSFRIGEAIDSYGESVKYTKSSRGQGFAASDKRSDQYQRSFEYGSGYYQSEELSELGTVKKDSKMTYAPSRQIAGSVNVSYDSLWYEGMITRNPSKRTAISESIRSASYIKKETEIGPSSLSILGEFNGSMDIKAVLNPNSKAKETAILDQSLIGSYRLDTAISIYTTPKHLYPHVSISKEALKADKDVILFLINVTNDGNKPLKSINVTDRLPEGLSFINSSIRPKAEGRNISWTIPSLDISRTLTIKLRAKVNDIYKRYRNEVDVTASYEEEVLSATNSTIFLPDSMPCCLVRPFPPGALGYSNATEKAWTEKGWGSWSPGRCIGINSSSGEDCFKAIDEYYRELDENSPCPDLP
jgi:uncharacterized repeat protein (TIGR01451 family)